MAGIDKIYGSQDQYEEFHKWCSKHKKEALDYFYPREDYESEHRPITNFPEDIDMWLLENCPLEWVTSRIKEQYDIE